MAGQEKRDHLVAQLLIAHALSGILVACLHQQREQVIVLARAAAAPGDDPVDDFVECRPRGKEAAVAGRGYAKRNVTSSKSVAIARPIVLISPSTEVLNNARVTTSIVRRENSAPTSSGWPRSASGRQRSSISRVASVINPPKAATRLRWNAGWARRRWRRQKSPSLVKSPLPRNSLSVPKVATSFE